MAKNNPVIHVPLLFIKIIWKNVDTFLRIREKMAADLFAVLGLYQGTFYASFHSMSTALSAEFMESLMLLCNYS